METVARCADSGLECDFEARAWREDEVLELCVEHAQHAHGMDENPVELAERIISASRALQAGAGPRWRRRAA